MAMIIRTIATTWVMYIARHQNREAAGWCFSALVFPAITLCYFQCCFRNIDGINLRVRKIFSQADSDGAAAGTDIDNDRTDVIPGLLNCLLDEQLLLARRTNNW